MTACQQNFVTNLPMDNTDLVADETMRAAIATKVKGEMKKRSKL